MLSILHSAHPNDYELILLQEPYLDKEAYTRANNRWRVVYPSGNEGNNRFRSIILVSTRIATSSLKQLEVDSSDVTAISIQTKQGEVNIFNIYNDCNNDDSIVEMSRAAEKIDGNEKLMIWAGDFNRHHPMWDNAGNAHLFTNIAIEAANRLIEATERFDLDMMLPEGIPTLEASNTKNLTRVDNIFATNNIHDRFIRCDTDVGL